MQEMPGTPMIDHVPPPLGAAPPVVPTTVAVKVTVSPSDALAAEVVTETIGDSLLIDSEKDFGAAVV